MLFFKHSPDRENIFPKKPTGIASFKSRETGAFYHGKISFFSAEYKS